MRPSPFSRSNFKPFRANPSRRGFALVLALLIMAFAVLLAVSLSAVVELQMRNSRSALSENKARNAAKFAAYMAMAQVQSSLGPDCRISANAAIFDEEIFPEIQRVFYYG